MNRPAEEGAEVVREMVAESVAAMVMAMDDTRLGTRWWKRRCRHGSRETGSNWHKPATGRVDNDAPRERARESERARERRPERRQINSERYTIHASPRSRFGSPFLSVSLFQLSVDLRLENLFVSILPLGGAFSPVFGLQSSVSPSPRRDYASVNVRDETRSSFGEREDSRTRGRVVPSEEPQT